MIFNGRDERALQAWVKWHAGECEDDPLVVFASTEGKEGVAARKRDCQSFLARPLKAPSDRSCMRIIM